MKPIIPRLRELSLFAFNHWAGKIYWLIPLGLVALQWVATSTSMRNIRYEELAESVRNVYWLDHRLLYDGISSNVGWYGTLLIVYKLFGFSLFKARCVRLVLHLVGLFCVANLLRRVMGVRVAGVPLLVIGLSPTLLYFNTMQTSYGVDLPYAAICLWLLYWIRFCSIADAFKCFAFGTIAMVAAMSYPTFLLYLPSLVLIGVWHWRNNSAAVINRSKITYLLSSIAGFVLPLFVSIFFLQSARLLIHDPVTGAGLFRGGGHLGFDGSSFRQSLMTCFRDLLAKGNSYYFDVTQPEFSGAGAISSLVCIALASIYLIATRRINLFVGGAIVLTLLISLILPNLDVGGAAGIRRCTGLLAAFYALFATVWNYFTQNNFRSVWLRRCGILLCLLLPLSHTLKYRALLSDIAQPNPELEQTGFTIDQTPTGPNISFLPGASVIWFSAKSNPVESLAYFLDLTQAGEPLQCLDEQNRPGPCRYAEIYAAIAGYRSWNRLPEKEIRAWDWKSGTVITLRPSLWAEYYFPH